MQISPSVQGVQMNRGSVQYIKIKAVKTFTVVGILQDEHGDVLKNRYVSSDVSSGVINAEGVLTLDSGMAKKLLKVRAEGSQPALQCELPKGMDKDKKVKFVSEVRCRAASAGAGK